MRDTDLNIASAIHNVEYDLDAKLPHEHQFVIPVEWESGFYSPSSGDFVANAGSKTFSVTKLRCACGEETTR